MFTRRRTLSQPSFAFCFSTGRWWTSRVELFWMCDPFCRKLSCFWKWMWMILWATFSFVYYRKRGSASYIVREWLLWVVERERRLWRQSISHWNREWSCIWLPRRRVDPTRRRVLSLSSARVHVKTRSLALECSRTAGSSDWWMTIGKGKLCVRWSACRGSPWTQQHFVGMLQARRIDQVDVYFLFKWQRFCLWEQLG